MTTTDHTLIMATMATERCTTQFVQSLADAGMRGIRINSAHVTPADIAHIVSTVRSVDPSITILMDTKGPEIRTTDVASPIELCEGHTLTLAGEDSDTTAQRICLTAHDIHTSLQPGHTVMIDDGDIQLLITEITAAGVKAQVTRAGILGSRKTVNIPGCQLPPLPALSERDRINIEAGKQLGIDLIAHSFVRSRADVDAVRRAISGTSIRLYSKIECPQAVENLHYILDASDGLLVARGDLGTCMPLSDIPVLQYDITAACRKAGKPFILSTQILHSMILAPAPTRAEVNDIAMAVMQGAEWLLLCGETAQGQYPLQCVETMQATILSVENHSLRCKIN